MPIYRNFPQDNTTNMAKALSATSFPEWRGEVDADTNFASNCIKAPLHILKGRGSLKFVSG